VPNLNIIESLDALFSAIEDGAVKKAVFACLSELFSINRTSDYPSTATDAIKATFVAIESRMKPEKVANLLKETLRIAIAFSSDISLEELVVINAKINEQLKECTSKEEQLLEVFMLRKLAGRTITDDLQESDSSVLEAISPSGPAISTNESFKINTLVHIGWKELKVIISEYYRQRNEIAKIEDGDALCSVDAFVNGIDGVVERVVCDIREKYILVSRFSIVL
jgi:hypothetical protein